MIMTIYTYTLIYIYRLFDWPIEDQSVGDHQTLAIDVGGVGNGDCVDTVFVDVDDDDQANV